MARPSKRSAKPEARTERRPAPPVEAMPAPATETPAPERPAVEMAMEAREAAPPPLPVAAAPNAECEPAGDLSQEIGLSQEVDLSQEIADSLRALVVRGVDETRARYEAARIVGEQAFAAVEASYGAAHTGVSAIQLKTLEALQAGAEAQFELLKALASVKSISELVTLHTEHARRQYEDAATRAKDIAELARKVAEESSAPLRAHVAQTFNVAV